MYHEDLCFAQAHIDGLYRFVQTQTNRPEQEGPDKIPIQLQVQILDASPDNGAGSAPENAAIIHGA